MRPWVRLDSPDPPRNMSSPDGQTSTQTRARSSATSRPTYSSKPPWPPQSPPPRSAGLTTRPPARLRPQHQHQRQQYQHPRPHPRPRPHPQHLQQVAPSQTPRRKRGAPSLASASLCPSARNSRSSLSIQPTAASAPSMLPARSSLPLHARTLTRSSACLSRRRPRSSTTS
jgi:hypothetical protein